MTPASRARAYLATMSPAIAGQGGHAATFTAACRLVEFGVAGSEAWEILSEWNLTRCKPPWTERDLQRKLAEAYHHTTPKPEFAAAVSARNGVARSPQSPPSPTGKRPSLPPLRLGTAADFSRLAELRGLAREGVALASEKGLLRFGEFRGHVAWLVLDKSKRVAQARRLDGELWETKDGEKAKAVFVKDSQAAWPVGIGEAADFPAVALCEGGPDLLAACHFITAEGRERDVAPVTMLGGCPRIHADALPLFRGKHVRIFPHFDDTGDNAANRWAEQLTEAGADVDAFSLAGLRRADGEPVKDLCDLAAIHADDFEEHRCLWNLFP